MMTGPVVTGNPVDSPVMLIGQAPGDKEGPLGKPFAWTAGKTMFKWFSSIGIEEEHFRNNIYMAAVCRCFPGFLNLLLCHNFSPVCLVVESVLLDQLHWFA